MLKTVGANKVPDEIVVYNLIIDGKLVKSYVTLHKPVITGFTDEGLLVVVAADSPDAGALLYRTKMDGRSWFYFLSGQDIRKDNINSVNHNHAFNLYWEQI